MRCSISILMALLLLSSLALAQYGNRSYRGTNMYNGNQIRCQFYNYGLLGNIDELSFEWPNGTGNEYIGDFSPLLGVEFVHPSGDTLHSVITSDGPRGNSDAPPGGGYFWGFEPLPGFVAAPPPNSNRSVAMSDQPDTWPSSWPNHTSEWNGQWIGLTSPGAMWGVQESYFQMDDNSDKEWRVRNDQTLYPFPNDTARGGLGLRVECRGMEYSQSEYQDALVLMYILHNDGQVIINRARFGFMVGTLVGGRQDPIDDVDMINADTSIVYTYDSNDIGSPGWVPVSPTRNVGVVGTTFLKNPGNRKITGLYSFSPPGATRMNDDNSLWSRMQPGLYHYDQQPHDGDYIVSTGDFELMPGSTDTIIAAVVFGEDLTDLEGNVQMLRNLVDDGMYVNVDDRFIFHPSSFILSVYPNPFNPSTNISFDLPRSSQVKLSVFDISGRLVETILNERRESGRYSFSFDGASLASGIYFVRLNSGEHVQTAKMILLK